MPSRPSNDKARQVQADPQKQGYTQGKSSQAKRLQYGGVTPLTVHRGCTDTSMLAAFLVALAGLCAIIGWGTAGEESGHFRCPFGQGDGDLMRFGELRDFQGNVCGEAGRGKYLYFCKVGEELDLAHHVCVEQCPTSSGTSTSCFYEKTGEFEATEDYPTVDFSGLFCMPADPSFSKEIDSMLQRSKFMEYMLKFSEAARAQSLLAISGVTALLLAFMYLFLLQHFTYCLMWVGFVVVIAVPGIIGGYLIDASQNGGIDRGPFSKVDEKYDLIIGVASASLSFIFFLVAFCKRDSINVAADCVEKACECIFGVPSLILEPIFSLVGRVAIFVPLLIGLLLLLSCGNVTDSIDLTKQTFFDFNLALKLLIVYYVFMMAWIMELCTAVSQFVVAYTVELWWFVDQRRGGRSRRASWGVLHGFCVAIEHHLGTLLYGALVIKLTRPVRMIVGPIAHAADERHNPLAACVAEICCCCVDFYRKYLDGLNKNAYADVAMNSSTFCKGAKQAMGVLATEGTAASTMHGTTALLQLAGLGGISGMGAFITWELSTQCQMFSDPDSEQYVQDPMYLAILSAIISFAVALPFLHIFDVASDTILYCEAVEEMWRCEDEELTQRPGCCSSFLSCSPLNPKPGTRR